MTNIYFLKYIILKGLLAYSNTIINLKSFLIIRTII